MKNVIVVFGGTSVEREISVITGVLTLNSVDKEKYNPIPVFIDGDGKWYTGKGLDNVKNYKSLKVSALNKVTVILGDSAIYRINRFGIRKRIPVYACINCLHGINGEDGSLSGLLKLCGIPNCSPSLFQSSMAMDKDFTKVVLKGIRVDTLPCYRLYKNDYFDNQDEKIFYLEKLYGYPMIVKPSTLGSSIGITVAYNSEDLDDAIRTAFKYDGKVIVERALENFTEINCGCYRVGNEIKVSELEQPIPTDKILSFADKYTSGDKSSAEKIFPANVSKRITSKVKRITRRIYERFGFSGVIRIDFMVTGDEVYVNEINTVPGSLSYYLYSDTIKGFTKMLDELIENGVNDFNRENNNLRSFTSNVLSLENVKGKK